MHEGCILKRAIIASMLLACCVLPAACGGDSGVDAGDASRAARSPIAGASVDGGSATTPSVEPEIDATMAPRTAPTPGIDPNITGGDADSAPQIVATAPAVTPRAGVTPMVDPTEVAEPEADGVLRLVIDLDASQAGLQATRDVNAGDTIRVAVAIVGAPPPAEDSGGVAAFNFVVSYDKTKLFAPTISGGPATQRNPAPNIDDLGGDAASWQCLPAPEGDLDDPGGIVGDGNASTGQAFLSCFNPAGSRSGGTIVLGVITFEAIAPGSVQLTFGPVSVGDASGVVFATCGGGAGVPQTPCEGATLRVR